MPELDALVGTQLDVTIISPSSWWSDRNNDGRATRRGGEGSWVVSTYLRTWLCLCFIYLLSWSVREIPIDVYLPIYLPIFLFTLPTAINHHTILCVPQTASWYSTSRSINRPAGRRLFNDLAQWGTPPPPPIMPLPSILLLLSNDPSLVGLCLYVFLHPQMMTGLTWRLQYPMVVDFPPPTSHNHHHRPRPDIK